MPINCEFNCPYFRDPAIKKLCPNTNNTISAADAIQGCAEKVSHIIINRRRMGPPTYSLYSPDQVSLNPSFNPPGAEYTAPRVGIEDLDNEILSTPGVY